MSSNRFFPSGSRLSRSTFDRERDAYSATDIEAVIYGVDKSTGKEIIAKLADIQSLSYSSHRDASPVRTLGRSNPKSYTMGSRTIAGSIIFATFNRRALNEVYTGSDKIDLSSTVPDGGQWISEARVNQPADTIPPFDIIMYFTSEQGNDSIMNLYRVQIMDEGQTFSVQDVYTEHTMQYVAGGVSLMEKVDDIWRRSFVGENAVFKNVALVRRAQANGLNI